MKEPMYLDIVKDAPDSTKYDAKRWYQMRDFFYYENGPYWYRGYVKYDTLGPQLNSMLQKYKSKIHVVAHTPLESITQRYDGKPTGSGNCGSGGVCTDVVPAFYKMVEK